MAINFPHNPNVNDVHTEASLGKSWKWDGTTWLIYSSSTTGIGYSDLSVTTEAAQGGGSLTYNNANGQFTFKPAAGSGGGATNFTGLGDTPSSLLAGKWLKVNTGGTALEWTDAPSGGGATTFTGLNDTPATLNAGKLLKVNAGGTALEYTDEVTVVGTITVANENTDTECYPLFSKDATGNIAPKTVTSLKLNSSSGQLEAGSFKKTGGTSSEFLKADGSVDSSTYSTFSGSYVDLSNKPTIPAAQIQSDWNQSTTSALDFIKNKPAVYGNSDVDTHLNQSNPNSGHVLSWNGSDYQWVAQSGGGGGSGGGNVAVGSVMIWSGAANSIPTGWQLCDGTNGSPDLRDKFVVGAGSTYAVDATGGSADAVVVSHNHGITDPGHDHDVEVVTDSGSGNNSNVDQNSNNSNGVTDSTGIQSNTTGITINNEGVSGTNANLPPYYALCYIYCTAAGSNQNFIGLDDTPGSYTADKWLKVNSGATALEFVNAPSLTSLSDVTISGSPADDSILQYDTNDSKWKPATLTSGNTTYTLSAVQGGTSVNIRLTGSDSTDDNVLLTPGTGLELDSITADGFTIKSTDTLDSVTGRGATTNNDVTVGSLTCNDLTVNGTTTTVNSNTVNIGDSNLTLNSDETGTPSQDGGITIERGTSTNVELRWNETTDKWQYTNDGTNYSDIGSSSTDNDTTYSVSCVDGDNADEEKIRLTAGGSGSGTDDVVLEAGTGLSVARSGDKITFTNTVSAGSDTTYDMKTAAVTGGGIIRLENELDNTTDDIQVLGGTNITVSRSADHKLTINGAITNLTSLSDVTISGSVPNDSILQYDTGDNQWKPVAGNTVGTTIPAGTIVMYNGTTAPSGWALCDGGGGRPDLRDKFVIGAGSSYAVDATGGYNDSVVVSHNHGSGNTGNQSANHSHGSGNFSGSASTHNGHTHDDGNYAAAAGGSHTHQANVTANTQNQSANHYHTIGGNKPDGSPGTWNATASGGNHGHSYRLSNGHPQSNMVGMTRSGGDDPNSTNNTDILSSGGSHTHNVNLTGVTTGGIDQNHYHSMSFNINTSPPLTQSEHTHNISGNSGSGGNHSHNVNFSGNTGNQSANHTHSINSEGVSGSGRNIPPYYALTYIIKT